MLNKLSWKVNIVLDIFIYSLYILLFIVEDGGEEGLFLVRDSNTSAGDFVLSVLFENQVVHYQIRRHGEDAFFSIGNFVIHKVYLCCVICC